LRALQAGDESRFDAPSAPAIAYCTRFDAHGDGPDSREELFAHFTQEQIVEITLVAAMANFTNRFNNGLPDASGSVMPILSGIHPVAEALRAKTSAGAAAGGAGRGRPALAGTDSTWRGAQACRCASSRGRRSTGWRVVGATRA